MQLSLGVHKLRYGKQIPVELGRYLPLPGRLLLQWRCVFDLLSVVPHVSWYQYELHILPERSIPPKWCLHIVCTWLFELQQPQQLLHLLE